MLIDHSRKILTSYDTKVAVGLSCDRPAGVKFGLSCDRPGVKFGLSCDRSGVNVLVLTVFPVKLST